MSMRIRMRERLKKLLSRNLTTAFTINSIFLVLVVLFCDMKYEVSDDYMMDAVLSGAFGDTVNPYLLFSNVIYGFILKPLYIVFPKVSWYFVFQLLVCFCSLSIVTYLILEKNHRLVGIVLSVLFVAFFSDDLYLLMQFTKTATVAMCAGGALFLYGIWNEKVKRKTVLISSVLVIVGSWIRFDCVYISLLFLLLMFALYSFAYFKHKELRKLIIRNLLLCCGLVIIAFLFKGLDFGIRSSNVDYKSYMELNSLRAGVTDSANYGYESIVTELDNMNLDGNDYWMLRSWNVLDHDVFTEDVLENIAKAKGEYHTNNVVSFKQMVKSFISRGYQHYTVVFGIFIIMFVLLFLNPSKIPQAFFGLVVTATALLYFYYEGRVVYRVEYSVFVGFAVFLMMLFDVNNITEEQKRAMATLGILICLFKTPLYIPDDNYKHLSDETYAQYVYDIMNNSSDFNVKKYRISISERQPQADLLKYIESDDENFYLMDFSTTIQRIYLNFPPWERIEKGIWEKYYYFGSVTYGYPDNDALWGRKGIDTENPNKSLVNKNIYVIDNRYYDTKLLYLQKYHYPQARKELVAEVDGFNVWKYYEK